MKRPFDSFSVDSLPSLGLFAATKMKGMSSQQFLFQFKKKFPRKTKLGHFGTLDPLASGLMLFGSGHACRLSFLLQDQFFKTYIAQGFLGEKTSTGDSEGEIVKTVDSSFSLERKTKEFWEESFGLLVKNKGYWQVPHLFSACKQGGIPLYTLARQEKGEGDKNMPQNIPNIIDKKAVWRTLFDFKVISVRYPLITFSVTVSSGTYIRSFFEDLCEKVGTVGHLKNLIRQSIGPITILPKNKILSVLPQELWPSIPFISISKKIKEELWLGKTIALEKKNLPCDSYEYVFLGEDSSFFPFTLGIPVESLSAEEKGLKIFAPKINFTF